jgi:lipoic acid synthetase
MLYIDTSKASYKDCSFYFGLEEYLIKDYNYEEDIFLLWNVVPTVMIGRHQVTTIEIDENYIKEHNIKVVRRNSGGGAVYTDLGCLQFSFITDKKSHKDIFGAHVHHIVDAVNELGLQAKFTGRNDILHLGRKFSGNAEFIHKDKMVIHGTILFNSNMDHLIGSLTPDKAKLTKHAVTSVKSRVLNISEELSITQDQLYDFIVSQIKTSEVRVEDLDLNAINKYAQKFSTDEWNYGKNPKFDIRKKEKFDAGNITFDVVIKNNQVTDFKLSGDFFSLNNLTDFENAFIGVNYTYESFVKVLKNYKVKDYIYKLRHSEFLGVFFERPIRITKPDYLKIDMKQLNKQTKEIRALLRQHNLHTVCQEASCPNQLECFSNKTATFMILGTRCTRNCAFCDVIHGDPDEVDPYEPKNILHAVQIMGLKHVVVTSVTRDDLEDYGSKQFVQVINELKNNTKDVTIEVLIPDFMGDYDSIKRVVDAAPDVINHNLETTEELYDGFRDNADYRRSLKVLETVKKINPNILTKSGIMVGIGETQEQVFKVMDDLRDINCDIMTIGQYLRPSKDHIEVQEYVSLEVFELYKQIGKQKGFRYIASGPMVRSSYQAQKQFEGE